MVDAEDLHELALERAAQLPAAVQEFPFGPEYEVMKVLGKVFLIASELRGEPIVILKADPRDAELLRESVEAISPGYHMNKRHWITVAPGPSVDRNQLEDLVTDSYRLVVATLPRARRPVDPEAFEVPAGRED